MKIVSRDNDWMAQNYDVSFPEVIGPFRLEIKYEYRIYILPMKNASLSSLNCQKQKFYEYEIVNHPCVPVLRHPFLKRTIRLLLGIYLLLIRNYLKF